MKRKDRKSFTARELLDLHDLASRILDEESLPDNARGEIEDYKVCIELTAKELLQEHFYDYRETMIRVFEAFNGGASTSKLYSPNEKLSRDLLLPLDDLCEIYLESPRPEQDCTTSQS